MAVDNQQSGAGFLDVPAVDGPAVAGAAGAGPAADGPAVPGAAVDGPDGAGADGAGADGAGAALPPLIEDFCDYKVPKNSKNDPVALYFRTRYGNRSTILQQANKETKDKIMQEEERIVELKKVFAASDPSHKEMLDELENLKKAWKASAKNKRSANKHYVDHEFAEYLRLTEIAEDRIERRKKEKLRILERVQAASWDYPAVEDDPIVENNVDIDTVTGKPGYGFTMSKITVDRHPPQDPSLPNYKLERFSIDEATEPNSAKNPWKKDPTATPDAIRYFHFPANDMEWIQVSI
jgi:hypothetical protein